MDTEGTKPIREMTRVELEALAKARGLPARTRLGKRELIEKLENWQGPPRDDLSILRRASLHELLRIAKEKGVPNKWRLRKEELVRAIHALERQAPSGVTIPPTASAPRESSAVGAME